MAEPPLNPRGVAVSNSWQRDSVYFAETCHSSPQTIAQQCQGMGCDVGGNASVKRPSDPARYACQRVGVAAEGNSQPNRIFIVYGLQKRCDCFRNRPLARLIEPISRPDARDRPTQVVTELLLDRAPNCPFGLALSGQKCGRRCGLRSSNSFRMVVSHFRTRSRFFEYFLQRLKCKSNRTHSHCRTVAPTVVWLTRSRLHPMPKSDAVFPIGVGAAVVVELVDIRGACKQTISNRYSKNCVVRKPALRNEKRELLRFSVPGIRVPSRLCRRRWRLAFAIQSRRCLLNDDSVRNIYIIRVVVAKSRYHSRCQNRLVTGSVVGKPEVIGVDFYPRTLSLALMGQSPASLPHERWC